VEHIERPGAQRATGPRWLGKITLPFRPAERKTRRPKGVFPRTKMKKMNGAGMQKRPGGPAPECPVHTQEAAPGLTGPEASALTPGSATRKTSGTVNLFLRRARG
jgi:hypothetical protein